MTPDEQLRQALEEFAAKHGPRPTLLAMVTEVNDEEATCTLTDDDGTEYHEVRLRPVLDGLNSQMIVPKLDTWALAVRIETLDQWMVLAAGETDKLVSRIGTTTLEQTAEGFTIRKGSGSLRTVLQSLANLLKQLKVFTPAGPSGTPLPDSVVAIELFETEFNNLLKPD